MHRCNILRLLYIGIIAIIWFGIYGCKDIKNQNLHANKINNLAYIYGEGSGSSFDIAKKNAIQDLATNLQVSVKYSMQQNMQQNDNTLQTRGISNTFLESKISNIPSIEVEKTIKKDNKITVRVRVEQALLEGAIANRIHTAQQQLQAMLDTCDTLAFWQYKKFKKTLQELQADITLYQALTKNMSYGNAMLATFQDSITNLPSYSITWDLHNLYGHAQETQAILIAELSKFIKIDSHATRTLYVQANTEGTLRFFLHFKDCKSNPENTIQIDTHASTKDILGAKNMRLGAIIYKTIQANY